MLDWSEGREEALVGTRCSREDTHCDYICIGQWFFASWNGMQWLGKFYLLGFDFLGEGFSGDSFSHIVKGICSPKEGTNPQSWGGISKSNVRICISIQSFFHLMPIYWDPMVGELWPGARTMMENWADVLNLWRLCLSQGESLTGSSGGSWIWWCRLPQKKNKDSAVRLHFLV